MAITYREMNIVKTGRAAWDYRVDFVIDGKPRPRWGTVEELKADIDRVLDGFGLPSVHKGFA